MEINTFAERHKAQKIYDTYFDPNSEHYLGFEFFDNLDYFGTLEPNENLDDRFDKIGTDLWNEMKKFDESILRKN